MSSFTPSQEQEIADLIRRALDSQATLVRQLQGRPGGYQTGDLAPTAQNPTALLFRSGGWLLCDGTPFDPTAFPDLYDMIGTTWNYGGEPPGTFRVPDFRQRFPIGVGNSAGLITRTLGEYGGEEKHILTVAELAVHTHTQLPHGHGLNVGPSGFGVDAVVPAAPVTGSGGGIIPTTAVNNTEGANSPHNNVPQFIAVNWIIKT